MSEDAVRMNEEYERKLKGQWKQATLESDVLAKAYADRINSQFNRQIAEQNAYSEAVKRQLEQESLEAVRMNAEFQMMSNSDPAISAKGRALYEARLRKTQR